MKRLGSLAVLGVTIAITLSAEGQTPDDTIRRIRAEAMTRSEIMQTLHVLTDVYGPRVTGSPSLVAAGKWAVEQMTTWGLTDGHLEPWEFGHPGWVNERFSAHLISPVKDALVGEVQAWTPGTNGPVTGRVVQLLLPERPTVEELTTYLQSMKETVRGRIVLADRHVPAPVVLAPNPTRRPDDRVREQFDPTRPPTAPPGRGRGAPTAPPPLNPGEISRRVNELLVSSGALARLNDGRREFGAVAAFQNNTYDLTKAVPTVILRNEDYGRIARLVADGRTVELELSIKNEVYPDGHTAFNAIAEWPGSDKKDEVVIIGGHLDSWHAATGATDNAIGCATMMEVARIFTALKIRPRRTLRVALWSGEEQGLLGSQAYVDDHFGTAESPKPEFARLSAYLNLDGGTGRIRGATVFGPPEAATVVRRALAPMADLGVAGAIGTDRRVLGGTDSTSFNHAGLPGIGFSQDPIQYEPFTHHTNLDTYERVIEDDVKAATAAIALTVYDLAMRDELLPRFDRAAMPKTGQ
jgi:carboxypeptidase Q